MGGHAGSWRLTPAQAGFVVERTRDTWPHVIVLSWFMGYFTTLPQLTLREGNQSQTRVHLEYTFSPTREGGAQRREGVGMRVLLVEDDARLKASLAASLSDSGYAVDAVTDGEQAELFAESAPYDGIILDVMLPKRDGILVCRTLRARGLTTPILMLTARDAIEDRVQGLDSGADDYLVKPFALHELLARLRALLRRSAPSKTGILALGDLTADPATHAVTRAGRPIMLSPREFALLEYFLRHPRQVLTREMIESHIWSYDFISASNVVDVYVRRLRRKIDDPFAEQMIETIRGLGYRISASAVSEQGSVSCGV